MTTYLLAGGGTAGHVNPLLAVADRLRQRDPEAEILVLGTREGLEARLVPDRGFELLTIERLPFPRRPNVAAVRFPRRLAAAVREVRAILADRDVDVVVGFGGYAAAPAYLAARAQRVPLVVHEANAQPGIANRLGARFADAVGVAFRQTPLRRATWVGMPLRPEIENLDRFTARAQAQKRWGLDPDRPVLLVTGGSSGARRLNETIAASAPLIVGSGWQIVHVTGEYRDTVDDPGLPGYHLMKYADRMDLVLAATDLAVSRAGTSTVAELAALGIPAVFVPYAAGNGEQRINAREAVVAGGALVVADADFTPSWVAAELVALLARRARIADMAARMASVGILDGTDRFVDLIDSVVRGGRTTAG